MPKNERKLKKNGIDTLYTGEWSQIEKGWWQKKILPNNLWRTGAVSFTFSMESIEKHDVFKLATGIIVYYSGGIYHCPKANFKYFRLRNGGNGWDYRCYLKYFDPLDNDLAKV